MFAGLDILFWLQFVFVSRLQPAYSATSWPLWNQIAVHGNGPNTHSFSTHFPKFVSHLTETCLHFASPFFCKCIFWTREWSEANLRALASESHWDPTCMKKTNHKNTPDPCRYLTLPISKGRKIFQIAAGCWIKICLNLSPVFSSNRDFRKYTAGFQRMPVTWGRRHLIGSAKGRALFELAQEIRQEKNGKIWLNLTHKAGLYIDRDYHPISWGGEIESRVVYLASAFSPLRADKVH